SFDGTGAFYDIEITQLRYEDDSNQNITLTVTDPALLAKTGGIVQGMSGSPILQNGKIVGAVTHVLVRQPEKGYGIFIESMLEHNRSDL
ncbi:MAG: SpoIVB peptidase, partial [Firmicutes bacterium]|nr:SpoIVB peptidase [Bacillota bacterium]